MQKSVEHNSNSIRPLALMLTSSQCELNTPVGLRPRCELNTPVGLRPSCDLDTPFGLRPSCQLNTPVSVRLSYELNTPVGIRPSCANLQYTPLPFPIGGSAIYLSISLSLSS